MRRQRNNKNESKNSAIGDRQGRMVHPVVGRASIGPTSAIALNRAEDPATTRLRRLLPTAWAMIRPYWSSEDRWAAWGLLLVVVALTLGMVYINVLFNQWNNAFFTALQNKNQTIFLQQLIRVCWLVGLYHPVRRLPALP